jgi:elongation factor Ts
MSQVTITEITKLRKLTGAGMMDCKNALIESNGDIEKAIEIIRKKGQLVANKRSGREASEGVVLSSVTPDGKFGAVTVLNCETDFVAKNAEIIGLAETILKAALNKKPADLEALKETQESGRKINDWVMDKVGITGEKMELSYYGSVKAEKVVAYIHPGNLLACVVGFNKANINEQVYKDVAMQVAAMNPVAVDKEFVSKERLEKELEIGREQARLEGKPENMLDKIAEGKLNKFFKESTLMNQEFIKDNKLTIRQYLQSVDKTLLVTGFCRYGLKD